MSFLFFHSYSYWVWSLAWHCRATSRHSSQSYRARSIEEMVQKSCWILGSISFFLLFCLSEEVIKRTSEGPIVVAVMRFKNGTSRREVSYGRVGVRERERGGRKRCSTRSWAFRDSRLCRTVISYIAWLMETRDMSMQAAHIRSNAFCLSSSLSFLRSPTRFLKAHSGAPFRATENSTKLFFPNLPRHTAL